MVRPQSPERMHGGSLSVLTPLRITLRSHRTRLLARLLWATGLVVLIVLCVLAHISAQFPGDAAISGLIRPLHRSILAGVIEFPSNVNQPTVGAIL